MTHSGIIHRFGWLAHCLDRSSGYQLEIVVGIDHSQNSAHNPFWTMNKSAMTIEDLLVTRSSLSSISILDSGLTAFLLCSSTALAHVVCEVAGTMTVGVAGFNHGLLH